MLQLKTFISVSIAVLALTQPGRAQRLAAKAPVQLKSGPADPYLRDFTTLGIVGDTAQGYVMLLQDASLEKAFIRLDKDLVPGEPASATTLQGRLLQHLALTSVGGKPTWFCYGRAGGRSDSLFAQELDVSTGGLAGGRKCLLVTQQQDPEHVPLIRFSRDSSKILYAYCRIPAVRSNLRNKDVYQVHVFDRNLTQLYEAQLEMPYVEAMMDNLDFLIDHNGTIHSLAKVFAEPKKILQLKVPSHLELLSWLAADHRLVKTQLRTSSQSAEAALTAEGPDGSICVAGFTAGPDGGDMTGAVFFRMTPGAGNPTAQRFNIRFSPEIIKAYSTNREVDDADRRERKGALPGIEDLKLRHLVVHDDASMEIAGEEERRRTVNKGTTYSGQVLSYTIYTMRNIVDVRVGADGSTMHVVKLPKSQETGSAINYGSFALIGVANRSYLVYNDHPGSNYTRTDDAPLKMDPNRPTLVAQRLEADGKLQRLVLVNGTGDVFYPAEAVRISGNSLIGHGTSLNKAGRSYRLTFN